MDFLENFQVDEKCENEAFLHENYIKMPQKYDIREKTDFATNSHVPQNSPRKIHVF